VDSETIAQRIGEQLDGTSATVSVDGDGIRIECSPSDIRQAMSALHDGSPAFEYLSFITAVDYLPTEGTEEEPPQSGRLELVYHVIAVDEGIRAFVTTSIGRPGSRHSDPCRIASVAGIYPGANWHERECFDLFGVEFEGHPDLRRILLPEEWHGYPLLRDYDPSVNELEYVPEKRWPEVADKR